MSNSAEHGKHIEFLKYAEENVPYYIDNNSYNSDVKEWDEIPVLSKKTVRENSEKFISERCKREYYMGKLLRKNTSGSTGLFMDILWSINDYSLANREAWKYRKKWYNIDVNDRYISFHTTLYSSNTFVDEDIDIIEKGVYTSFSKNLLNEKIHEYISHIKKFKPVWMLVQPSVLYIMLELVSADELNVLTDIKYVELTGEYLQPGMKAEFKKRLPDTAFNNMYGTTETGCVSFQCPYGCNHILNNAYVDIYEGEKCICSSSERPNNYYGKTGGIVLTNIKNRSMPLIKYDIGDYGSIEKSNCKCGFKGFDLSVRVGRKGEVIHLPENIMKSSFSLWYPVESVNYEFNNPIVKANFCQINPEKIVAYIVLKKEFTNWEKAIKTSLVSKLKMYVSPQIDYEVSFSGLPCLAKLNKQQFFTCLKESE